MSEYTTQMQARSSQTQHLMCLPGSGSDPGKLTWMPVPCRSPHTLKLGLTPRFSQWEAFAGDWRVGARFFPAPSSPTTLCSSIRGHSFPPSIAVTFRVSHSLPCSIRSSPPTPLFLVSLINFLQAQLGTCHSFLPPFWQIQNISCYIQLFPSTNNLWWFLVV